MEKRDRVAFLEELKNDHKVQIRDVHPGVNRHHLTVVIDIPKVSYGAVMAKLEAQSREINPKRAAGSIPGYFSHEIDLPGDNVGSTLIKRALALVNKR